MSKDQVVFISDLHLGDERFSERQGEILVDFLQNYVIPRASRLIIVGDLFEITQQPIKEILRRSRDILHVFWEVSRTTPIDYVVGNHDLFAEEFLGKYGNVTLYYPRYNFELDDLKFHVEHGHLHQHEYKMNPRLYENLAKVGGFLDKINPELEDKLFEIKDRWESLRKAILPTSRKEGASYEKDLDDYCAKAMELFEKGMDFVVFGHTHKVDVMAFGKHRYINCGDWLVHSNFATYSDGRINIFKWEGRPVGVPT